MRSLVSVLFVLVVPMACALFPSSDTTTCESTGCTSSAAATSSTPSAAVPTITPIEERDVQVGVATKAFLRDDPVSAHETALGDLVADALLEHYRSLGAQIAIVNTGALRSGLPSAYVPKDRTLRRSTPPFDLVHADVELLYTFDDRAIVRPVTGAALWTALEHGIVAGSPPDGRFPQIAGFSFTFTAGAGVAHIEKVTLANGRTISADSESYILVLPNFINYGGDGYVWPDGSFPPQDRVVDTIIDYLRAHDPITPGPLNRIAGS